jgi:hypothetical protein
LTRRHFRGIAPASKLFRYAEHEARVLEEKLAAASQAWNEGEEIIRSQRQQQVGRKPNEIARAFASVSKGDV